MTAMLSALGPRHWVVPGPKGPLARPYYPPEKSFKTIRGMSTVALLDWSSMFVCIFVCLIRIIIEGLSLLQSIPPTTASKQTQPQKQRRSRARKLLGANSYV